MKRPIKVLHTLGAIGLMGGLGAYLVLSLAARGRAPLEVAGLQAGAAAIASYLLVPSLTVCLVSGVLSIAAHPPFMNAGWVWMKAATGVVVFEATLGLSSHAKNASDPIGSERGVIVTLLVVSLANVILGVWRPRFRRGRPNALQQRAVEDDAGGREVDDEAGDVDQGRDEGR